MKNPLRILLASLPLAAMPFLLQAQEEEAPYIIFISENSAAEPAIEGVVIAEYNAEQREALRETDLTAWEEYEAVESWRQIPNAFKNARYDEIKTLLGLEDDDPADKGFTDLLESAGYRVYRSQTEVTSDPITGAITRDHEFWGDVGEPGGDDYFLSEDQITFLSEADLIIVSMNVNASRYSWSGRVGGESSTILLEQWNGLEVPIIAMNNKLIGTNEFGSWGWGWSYGFDGQFNVLGAYDRQAIQGSPRFVFPDLRPVVTTNDPEFLEGVTPVDDDRLPIYLDYDLIPFTPRVQRKFSNNENFNYPDSANVILELDTPSFVNAEVGDIPTHTPVMMEFPPNIPAFNPTGGVPAQKRVGVPAAHRLYFAAGIRATGLYNLSETGETVFLNAVEKYAGPASGEEPDPTWYGYAVDDLGWADTGTGGVGGWLNGWVNVTEDPWVNVLSLGTFVYVPDNSGWVYVLGAPENSSIDPGTTWYGFGVDELGWADTGTEGVGGWLNGWVNVAEDPWINSLALDAFIYIPDNSGWAYIPPVE